MPFFRENKLSLQFLFCYLLAVLIAVIPFSFLLSGGQVFAAFIVLITSLILGSILIVSFFSSRIVRPLERLRRGAERFANGELGMRIYPSRVTEIASIQRALNTMAAQLDEKLATVRRQHQEQQAILSSMNDGILAVSKEGRVLLINSAAATLLEVSAKSPIGRLLEEVVKEEELLRFVDQQLESPEGEAKELLIERDGGTLLEVYASNLLRDGPDRLLSGIIVGLRDVTQIKRLERMRSDFVANVSHELKTPVTSIMGFVETLLEGAWQDSLSLQKFLRIIGKQADRLNSIVNDLLTLAKLEHKDTVSSLEFVETPLKPILNECIESFEPVAKEKGLKVRLECPDTLTIFCNPGLISHAITNLIDNAVKYSDTSGQIELLARKAGDRAVISVKDTGHGISPEHLERLFERFYRADHGRARRAGGTGLGLAIVKHVAQVHSGRVFVESELGVGSLFSIELFRRQRDRDLTGG